MKNATLVLMTIVMACGLIVSQEASAAEYSLRPAEFRPGRDGPTVVSPPLGGETFQVDSFFDVFTELSADGTFRVDSFFDVFHIDSFFDVFTELSVDGGDSWVDLKLTSTDPLIPTKVMVTPILNGGDQTGMFETEIISMDLTGEVKDPTGAVTVIRAQAGSAFGLPSPGAVGRSRVGTELSGDGRFVVDSFFDITYEIEFGGPPAPGTTRMDGVPAPSGLRCDTFSGQLGESGMEPGAGPNTGWQDPAGTQWFPYPESTDPAPPWWNEWFYNDPLNQSRDKTIFWDMIISSPDETEPAPFEVAINYSGPDFPSPDDPTGGGLPLPPMPPMAGDESGIIREIIFFSGSPQDFPGEIEILADGSVHLFTLADAPLFIEDFNPEWVSIDIRFLDNVDPNMVLFIDGEICHECTPEPTTMAVLALGGLAVLRKRRKQ